MPTSSHRTWQRAAAATLAVLLVLALLGALIVFSRTLPATPALAQATPDTPTAASAASSTVPTSPPSSTATFPASRLSLRTPAPTHPRASSTPQPTIRPTAPSRSLGGSAAPTRRTVPIVMLVTTGWSWSQVRSASSSQPASTQAAPQSTDSQAATALALLAASASPANLVQRTAASRTCPADAWMTLSAGARSRATTDTPAPDTAGIAQASSPCTWPSSWSAAAQAASASGYTAQPGALADSLEDASASALAVGRGAVLALTDSAGTAPPSVTSLAEALGVPAQAAPQSSAAARISVAPKRPLPDLILVDTTDPASGSLTQNLALLSRTHVHARLVIASIAHPADPSPQLLLLPPGTTGWGQMEAGDLVASPSTHQPGLVQLTDLAPTLTLALGAAPTASMTGRALVFPPSGQYTDALLAPMQRSASLLEGQTQEATPLPGSTPAPTSPPTPQPGRGGLVGSAMLTAQPSQVPDAVGTLADQATRALASQEATLPAAIVMVVTCLATLLVAGLALRGEQAPVRRRRVRRLALGVAANPAGAWLASLLPWWRVGTSHGHPTALTLLAGITLMVASAALLALAASCVAAATGYRWVRPVLVATTIAVLLLGDGANGAVLGFNGLLGMDAIVAGRFYGVSNSAFALAAGALVVATVAVTWEVVHGPAWQDEPRGKARIADGGSGVGEPEHLSDSLATGSAAGFTRLPGIQAPRGSRARVRASVVVGLATLAALAADALPSTGADVGGGVTLVITMAAVWLMAVGARITWRRCAGVVLAAFAVVAVLAGIDLVTGPRTHLGEFLGQVAGGRGDLAVGTLTRKMGAIVSPFLHEPAALAALVVALAGAGVLAWWLRAQRRAWREGRSVYTWVIERTGLSTPWLGLALRALVVLCVVEVLVNDSGASMAVLTLTTTLPLLVAAVCEYLPPSVSEEDVVDQPVPVGQAR